jgi:hypothetical protein
MNSNAVTLLAAFIGLVGTICAAFITKPREPQRSQWPSQPWPSQSYPQPTWAPSPANGGRPPKISVSLWLGLAGLLLWIIPILGYVDLLPGLFIAIRDLRSPGTRRYASGALILCIIAFAFTLINSAVGAYQGYHGAGWWQH